RLYQCQCCTGRGVHSRLTLGRLEHEISGTYVARGVTVFIGISKKISSSFSNDNFFTILI
ncbi:hypothetical protein, partial [Mesobacillus sp.]|uniref:hypothetical protein n=1 Tax=Mesobacillus sp. TaxID=2675271 RepID=UPI003C704D91